MGEQGVGGRVDAVREGDGEGRRDVGVAGAEVQVAAGEAGGGGGVVWAVAGGLSQGVGGRGVPGHGDTLGPGVNTAQINIDEHRVIFTRLEYFSGNRKLDFPDGFSVMGFSL